MTSGRVGAAGIGCNQATPTQTRKPIPAPSDFRKKAAPNHRAVADGVRTSSRTTTALRPSEVKAPTVPTTAVA